MDRSGEAGAASRPQSSLVLPVGVIVAVAIVCVVVAVLSSARRADEVAVEQEQQLFVKGVRNTAERILREVKSVSTSEDAIDQIARHPNPDWISARIGMWLETFFSHDVVYVIDADDHLLYPSGDQGMDANALRYNLGAVLSRLRGTTPGAVAPYRPLSVPEHAVKPWPPQAAVMQVFAGRPALVIGIAVTGAHDPAASARRAPSVIAVRFIDREVLADIASRLQLRSLRMLTLDRLDPDDYVYDVAGADNIPIARFAWKPQKPGAEIVSSVLPFILVAFCGFALLAAFVLRHMRRTAKTIASTEDQLRHLAMHDPLCGLPNRIYFRERLETVIREVRDGGPTAAVFYIDLDHFKDVNDILGHPVGDELLEAVALRLRRVTHENDVVARLGGDEFAIVRFTPDDGPSLDAVADRIIATLCAPYALAEQSIVIGASIGIAFIDRNTFGAADIMRHADMALYRAKNEGRNRACVFDAAMDADLLQRKLLQDDLREAIANDALRLEYQPVVNASGEKMVGVEALARWRHPVHGEISPADFIPIAEHSGLIIDLGVWVLRRACTDGMMWPNLTIAVNVSPLQFRRADFVEVVERTLAETNFDPSRLELEVTESTLIGNVESAQAAMLKLKALGVKLALDDFGTGYSSLQYLRRFPFDRLKIDHSFVRSIENAADAAAIVHAVVSLGRGLGMKVTAEGVETAEQQLFLRAAGVHAMQGYRFGRPVPATEIANYQLARADIALPRIAIAG
jgi:diguanylate cyclase (GGDEF)-like protein